MIGSRIGLIVLALVAATPTAARPYGIDDLLRSEAFGNILVSPGGRWLVFERWAPFEEAANFHFNSMEVQRSRLFRVDLDHPGPAQPLVPVAPKVTTVAYSFSPDGRYLAFGRLAGAAWRLGVATMATGAVRWFDVAPDYNVFRPTLAWVSDRRLVALAAPDGGLPWVLDIDSRAQRELSKSWLDQQAGAEPTVTAIGSGPALPVTPDPEPTSLVSVDVESGETRTLAQGPFGALSVSADGLYAAVVGEGALNPAPVDRLLAVGDDQRRRRLTIVATGDGHIWQPCPDCDQTVASPSWALAGHRFAFFARRAGKAWAGGEAWLADAGTGHVEILALGGLRPVLGNYPLSFATVAFDWLGRDPLLLAHAHAGEVRADWYRLGRGDPVAVTARLSAPSANPVRGPGGTLLVASGRDVWRIGRRGARRLAAGQDRVEPIAPAEANRFARDTQVAAIRTVGTTTWVGFPGGRRGLAHVLRGPGRIDPVAGGADGHAIVATRSETGGVERLLVQVGGTPPVTVATLGEALAGVDPAQPVALHYRLGDGEAMTSWLYLPAQPASGTMPLIVMPYGGTVYGAEPPSPDGLGLDLGTSSVAAVVGHGYAVLLPSMPAMVAPAQGPTDFAGQILPAVDAAIATGRIDPLRLGLWGHSFGGYNVGLVVTETDRFAAALTANGIYDLASGIGTLMPWTRPDPGKGQSMLSNAGWAETGQPGMEATPWTAPRKYLDNSALYRADRIRTPLLIVAADQDVGPLGQGEALFSALFRQDKDAELLSYWGENHVLTSAANIRDFYARAFQWFDAHFDEAVRRSRASTADPPGYRGSDPTRREPSVPRAARAEGRHRRRSA